MQGALLTLHRYGQVDVQQFDTHWTAGRKDIASVERTGSCTRGFNAIKRAIVTTHDCLIY